MLAGEETVFLLGIYIVDKSPLGLEIERHGVALVFVAAHGKHRTSRQLARGVGRTRGVHQTAVEGHAHLVALQVHVLIFHLGVAIQAHLLGGCNVHE